jgi:hypothetical protein
LGILKGSGADRKLVDVVSLDDGKTGKIDFTADDLKTPPFSPLGVFIEKSADGKPDLVVKPLDGAGKFDFKLAISAKTKLNIKVLGE